MFYGNLPILNSFLYNQKLDVNEFWLGCTPIVVGVKNCRVIVTINFQWSFNIIDHTQTSDKVLQPYLVIRCLKTSNKLCSHGWRSYKSLFRKLPRDSSSSQHIYVSRSGAFIVLTSSKIRVWVLVDLQIVRLMISEHVAFCSLQVMHYAYYCPKIRVWVTHYAFHCLPMLQSRITQVSAQNSYEKCYVGTSTNLSIHQTSYCWRIGNLLHLSSFEVIIGELFESEFVSISYWGIFWFTIFHVESIKYFIDIALLWKP